MNNLRYFVSFTETTPIALAIIIDGQSLPPSGTWEEIDYTRFEALRNDIGDIEYLRDLCRREIDITAGVVRLRFITSVPGQAETYILKAQEARALKATGYTQTDLTMFPMIAAEMVANSSDLVMTCETIIAMEDGWKNIAAAVEKERISGKNTVNSATNAGEIILARNTAITSLMAIQ
jgi:hypothetical protein